MHEVTNTQYSIYVAFNNCGFSWEGSLYFHQVATIEYCNSIGWKSSHPWLRLAKVECILTAVFIVHFNVYLTSYHSIHFCFFREKIILMESVSYDLLCLKSKTSNNRIRKTYVLRNSGLLSEKTLLGVVMSCIVPLLPGHRSHVNWPALKSSLWVQ